MEYVRLGRTTQEVSRIGLGGLAFGGHYGPIEKIDILRTIHQAVDLGVTFFDTSPTYGDGRAEELLGEALGGHLDRVVISTKIGGGGVSELGTWRNNDRVSIIKRVEASLKRLGRDYLDLVLLYGPDPHTPPGETMDVLLELKGAGKILYTGTCDGDEERIRELQRYGRFDVIQQPYNMLNRTAGKELIPLCGTSGMAFLACEPFLCGLLHGNLHQNAVFDLTDLRVRDRRFRGQRYRDNVGTVNRLRRLAEQEGMTLTQLALGWLLQNPAVHVAVCGAKDAQQVRQIAGAGNSLLSPDQLFLVDQTVGPHMFEQPA
jgi:aryl-alcohol dehydrogenase-like predicted oxidoreductase